MLRHTFCRPAYRGYTNGNFVSTLFSRPPRPHKDRDMIYHDDLQRLARLSFGGAIGVVLAGPFTAATAFIQAGKTLQDMKLPEFLRAVRSGMLVRMGWTGVEKMMKQKVEERVRGSQEGACVRIWSGACAGTAQALACTSFEAYMLRRGLNATLPILNVVREVAKAPLRGVSFTLLRDVPFCAMVFPSVHYLSRELEKLGMTRAAANALAGALCGALAAACVTPADALKTRRQMGLPLWVPAPTVRSLYATAPLRFVRSLFVFGSFFAWNEYCKQLDRERAV